MNAGQVVFLLMCLSLKDTNAGYSTRFDRPPKTRIPEVPERPVVYPHHPPLKRPWDTSRSGLSHSVKSADESTVQKEVPQIPHGISGEHSKEPVGESFGIKSGSHSLPDLQVSKEVPHHIKEGHSKEAIDESIEVKPETRPSPIDGDTSHEEGHSKEAIGELIGVKPESHPFSNDEDISHEIKETVDESPGIKPDSHPSSDDGEISHESKDGHSRTTIDSAGIKTASHPSSVDGEIPHEIKGAHSKEVTDESVEIKNHPSVINIAEKSPKHEGSPEFTDIGIKPETNHDTHNDEVKIRIENPKDVIKPGHHSGISSTVLVENYKGEIRTKNEEKQDLSIPVGNNEDIKVDDYPDVPLTDEEKKVVGEGVDGKLTEPYPIKVTNANEKSVHDLLESLRLTRFLHLSDEVELKDLLTSEGPITIFAPSDFALSKLKADQIRSLATNSDLLKEFVLYHCVDGSFYGESLQEKDNFILNTKVDKNIHLNKYGTEWYVNGIPFTAKNQIGNNGAIHVIDHPLFPFPIGDILHTLETSRNFNIFCELIRNAKLDEEYFKNDDETYTIFAPTDVAFSKLPEANVEWLKWDIPTIKNMFRQLTVKGTYYTSCIPNLEEGKLSPLSGDTTLFLTGYPDAVSVNDVRLGERDITASNGCIHTIDDIWFLSRIAPVPSSSKKH